MEKNLHYPNLKQAFLLLLLFVVLQIAFITPLIFLVMIGILPDVTDAANFVPFISILIIVYIGYYKNQQRFTEVYALKSFNPSLIGPMLLTLIGAAIIISELDNMLQYFLPAPEVFSDMFFSSNLFMLLAVVVCAPVFEELLFRGLMLRGFLCHYSVKKAIVWSALLFGLAHLNPWQFPGAVFAGIIFGWWLVHTGSLLPGIFGHAIYNGVPFLLFHFNIQIPGYTVIGTFQPLWFDILGIIFAAGGIILTGQKLKRIRDKTEPNE